MIGAGAAGVIAAWRAATLGSRVLLVEKTPRIGTKILISGGGKCNIVHDGPLAEVLRAFRPNEASFIRPACYRFPNTAIVKMFVDQGLEVYTREDGRVFPSSGTAKDVVAILHRYLDQAGVTTLTETPVTQINSSDGRVLSVTSGQDEWPCRSLVLATGGSSYPSTGTTGDGWPWARQLGHTTIKLRAALAPMYMEMEGMDPRAGVALRAVLVKARQNQKEIARWRGDLLFTHRGISGPTVLGISRVVAERMGDGPVTIEVDLVPDRSFEIVRDQVVTWLNQNSKRSVLSLVEAYVPKSLVSDLACAIPITNDLIANQMTAKARNRLVETLKGWTIGQVRTVPLEKGEVVAGGVALDEVDPKTMASMKAEGLFLCGEILDIAGPVGGYNLQAAFATGYVAGESAHHHAQDR